MGVLGLNPFLQKACPDVFKILPDRFAALRGKTVVFDGTLITQRLHFAPMPHPYRHVLGWYRIMQELKESSVTAICVFDGKLRNSAKQMEVDRRREDRRILASRGIIEQHRLSRLQKMTPLVRAMRHLEPTKQISVLEGLRDALSDSQPVPPFPSPTHEATDLGLTGNLVTTYRPRNRIIRGHAAQYEDFKEVDFLEILLKRAGVSIDSSQEPFPDITELIQKPDSMTQLTQTSSPLEEMEAASLAGVAVHDGDPEVEKVAELYELIDEMAEDSPNPPVSEAGLMPPQVDELQFSMGQLYEEYKRSVESLKSAQEDSLRQALTASLQDSTDQRVDNIISKAQQQLTVEEGNLWRHLLNLEFPMAETQVTALSQKSSIMSESYKRRTQAPTESTYEESKEILRAMGTPCLETDGPFEAEALASAMVLRGQADFVASEDTDVLVYGAPLIRNMSSRNEPFVLVWGTEVWDALQLDQERFIDFVLLLGTDFSQRIKKLGPRRALKFIQEYGTIERVLEHEQRYLPRSPTAAYLQQIAVARMVFRTLPPVPDKKDLQQTADESAVQWILQKYSLWRSVSHEQDLSSALAGNYFSDSPFAT